MNPTPEPEAGIAFQYRLFPRLPYASGPLRERAAWAYLARAQGED